MVILETALADLCTTNAVGPRWKKITAYKGFSDVPVFTGDSEDYEQWSFQVKTYLATEDKMYKDYLDNLPPAAQSDPHHSTHSGPLLIEAINGLPEINNLQTMVKSSASIPFM